MLELQQAYCCNWWSSCWTSSHVRFGRERWSSGVEISLAGSEGLHCVSVAEEDQHPLRDHLPTRSPFASSSRLFHSEYFESCLVRFI